MDSPQRREFQSKMSIKSSPFDDVPAAKNHMSHVNKQAQQFYQTAYVQNPGNKWVDKKMIEESAFDMPQQVDGVQPSIMFEELN